MGSVGPRPGIGPCGGGGGAPVLLASLTNLEKLYLYANQVSDVSPLASLTNLTELYLWGNPLSQESIDVHVPNFRARGVEVTL